MQHQPLVASYRRDLDWCYHLLTSLKLNATGFLPPVVVVPSDDREIFEQRVLKDLPNTILRTSDVPRSCESFTWCRMMRAQVVMMSGDIHCPDADVVWLFGSDCFVHDRLSPEDGIVNGKPIMPFSTYAEIGRHHAAALCWQQGTATALGFTPANEFMRRLPLLYPRELYPAVRAYISNRHGGPFEETVYRLGSQKNFSESNVLGAYAWEYMHDLYEWFLVDGWEYGKFATRFPSKTIQFWSHGGMDLACDQHHQFHGQTPRQVMDRYYKEARARR